MQIVHANSANKAKKRAQHILETLTDSLDKSSAPWYTETWLDSAIGSVTHRFDDAFDRWRSLFRATTQQLKQANTIINSAAATEQDRKEANARHNEAFTQQELLLDRRATMNSDFYTYRYLASEGFLPGYNFPRLPLMAYIPGRPGSVSRDSFLSRPRFLGLSEFGPRSIIYHEGSTYRVQRAILSINNDTAMTVSTRLPLQVARICPACGYGHFKEQREFERCVSCNGFLNRGRMISNLYRIEQVSTRRAQRITSDEEERQRQGYEMISTLRFAAENGKLRVESIALNENTEIILELKYGPAATLWRINLGWLRREEKSVYGFSIDVNTGEWTKDEQAPTDVEDDDASSGKAVERITPFVEDIRNVLVVQPKVELSVSSMISLQYALKRGIEHEFQLEEAELAAEPLPDRNVRSTILLYEAAEGGAGVLTRLVYDPDTIRRVAKKALEICHYTSKSGHWTGYDDLKNQDTECEAGCYRCLLSYYNQPEHVQIDRQDKHMLEILCRLTRAEHKQSGNLAKAPRTTFAQLMNASSSSLEKKWLDFLKVNGYHLPDRAQPYLNDFNTRLDFAYTDHQTLIYIDGPHHEGKSQSALDDVITGRLEDAGFTVIRFNTDQGLWRRITSDYAWVFGTGLTTATE